MNNDLKQLIQIWFLLLALLGILVAATYEDEFHAQKELAADLVKGER